MREQSPGRKVQAHRVGTVGEPGRWVRRGRLEITAMATGSLFQKAITVVLVAIAAAMVAGELLGQPIGVGYVATGSMDPTLAVGDGFIAMPPLLAGEISSGDVITYEAQSIDGGGPTTHRVMEETDEGYITQGDANSFTDQDAGEPPVTDAQIYAVALQFNGEVVAIPSLGLLATTVQDGINGAVSLVGVEAGGRIGVVTTGFGVVMIVSTLLYGFLTDEAHRRTSRSKRRGERLSSTLVIGAIVVIIALPILTGMTLPSGTTTTNMLSADPSTADGSGRIAVGGSEEFDYSVSNDFVVPKVVMMEPASSGLEVDTRRLVLPNGGEKEVTLTIHAPEDTGTFARSHSQQHYFYLLPLPLIELLHAIHPVVARLTISLVATIPAVALYVFVMGTGPIRLRSAHR
ncbi:MAG: S26 family signal peptidase [Halohasta sp.]